VKYHPSRGNLLVNPDRKAAPTDAANVSRGHSMYSNGGAAMDDDQYVHDWHRTLRQCLRDLQRHHRAVQIARSTNSDEQQITSDQVRLVTALEQPIRVALLETDRLALKRWVGEIKRQFERAKRHPAISARAR
jgi:hypothetical protein